VAGPGKPQRLASVGEGGNQPALSRGGLRLAYAQAALRANIYRIEAPAGGTAARRPVRHIASSRWEMEPQFSPDGARIAFESNRSGAFDIWVCDRDGSNAVKLTAFGSATGSPHWSPDGREIAFNSSPEGHADIFVVNAGGGIPRRLTTHPANDAAPGWSRDGRWIYFASDRTGTNQIWKMPAAASPRPAEAIQVTRGGGTYPQESPNGELVYYYKSGGVWQVPVDGGEETRVLESLFRWYSFAVAGRGIYFIGRDEAVVGFFDFSTRAIHDVAALDKSRFGDLAVSPDGRTILYTQVDQEACDLMLVENFR
jgi:Tol biopolymer transport system component